MRNSEPSRIALVPWGEIFFGQWTLTIGSILDHLVNCEIPVSETFQEEGGGEER